MPIDASFDIYEPENAHRVSEALRLFIRGEPDGVFGLCAPDIRWTSHVDRQHAPFGGTYHGKDAVRDYFLRMTDAYEIASIVVEDVIPAGAEVIQITKVTSRPKSGSAFVSTRVIGRWTFKNRLAVAFEEFFDVGAAVVSSRLAEGLAPNHTDKSLEIYKPQQTIALSNVLSKLFCGDAEPLIDLFHSDAEWRAIADISHAPPGNLQGKDAITAHLIHIKTVFTLFDFRIVDVIASGETAIHIAELNFAAHATLQKPMGIRFVGFWEFENGLVRQYTEYFDVTSALAPTWPSQRNSPIVQSVTPAKGA